MLYLLLAILSSSLVSIFMRLSEHGVKNNMTMFMSNYIVCSLLALIMGRENIISGLTSVFGEGSSVSDSSVSIASATASTASLSGLAFAIGLGLVCGVFYLVAFVLFRYNIERNGVVLPAIFMKLGVLVPTLSAIIFFHENLSLTTGLGFLVAIVAIVLINIGDDKDSSKAHAALLLIILLLVAGMSDTFSNIYDKNGLPQLKDFFLFFTFFTALILSTGLKIHKKQSVVPADVLWGALIGIPNYFSARFLLLALSQLPAVLVYPAYNVAVIVVVTIIGVLAFREHMNRRKCTALLLMLGALVLLNI